MNINVNDETIATDANEIASATDAPRRRISPASSP
jgi:hypothetical protein